MGQSTELISGSWVKVQNKYLVYESKYRINIWFMSQSTELISGS
jgi:hypothetical protein